MLIYLETAVNQTVVKKRYFQRRQWSGSLITVTPPKRQIGIDPGLLGCKCEATRGAPSNNKQPTVTGFIESQNILIAKP